MLKRGKRSISGKPIGPHGSQIKRIKPQLTRRIIRRYHFLLQRKQILLKWLNVKQKDIDDISLTQLFENDSSFHDGWEKRGNDMKVKDTNIEDQLVKLQQQQQQKKDDGKVVPDERMYRYYLGYIMKEIRDEGGINTYQEASRMGQDANRGGDSSKILVQWLKNDNLIQSKGKNKQTKDDVESITALEIGSLSKHNAISTCGLFHPVTRIDLNNHNDEDGIIRQDFMERPLPKDVTNKTRFDLISCSLVLNFVPTPIDRGKMCHRFAQFLKQDRVTYLFIVLPLPCINNSRYMSLDYFTELMESLGYSRIQYHEAKKVCYFLFNRDPSRKETSKKNKKKNTDFTKKHKLQDGPGMNNFSIIL